MKGTSRATRLQVDFYPDLLGLLDRLHVDGEAWFAGKRFYFGCGGGTVPWSLDGGPFAVVVKQVARGRSLASP